jgi:hypothetical protein
MREARVEEHLVQRVKETGGFTRKVKWLGRRGAPDRFCGWPHLQRFAMPELKRPNGPDAEAHQKREHERLRACGIRVDVLFTKEQVDAWILEMTK